MEICTECGHEYNPPVTVPQPLPDLMCAQCATVLTPEEIANLLNAQQANNQEE
jgi:hypothetical protein